MSKVVLSKRRASFSWLSLAFCVTVISSSLNLFHVWRPEWSYHLGHFLDYTAPKIYVGELFVLALWIVTFFSHSSRSDRPFVMPHFRLFRNQSVQWLVALGVLFCLWVAFFTAVPQASFWWIFHIFLGPGLLFLWYWRQKAYLSPHLLEKSLVAVGFFQAFVGWFQWLFQKPLAPYWLLGESHPFSSSSLLTSVFWPSVRILPLGTTPHPNILAAWLLLGLLAIWRIYLMYPRFRQIALLLTGFIFPLFLITESFSAWITLALLAAFFFTRGKWRKAKKSTLFLVFFGLQVLFLALPFSTRAHLWSLPEEVEVSFARRAGLLAGAAQAISHSPLGVGPGQSLYSLNFGTAARIPGQFWQPVHHVWVIFVMEFGIWSIFVLCVYFVFVHNLYSLFFLLILLSLPIFTLDHYVYTLISGQFFLAFFVFILKRLFFDE